MMKNEKVIYLEDKEYPIELKRLKDPPKKIYTAGNIDLLKNNVFWIIDDFSSKITRLFHPLFCT